MGFAATCPYRTKITFDHTKVPSDRTNIPIYISKDMLPSGMFDTNGQHAKANGGDLRFTTDADGNTQIAQDVVTFYTDSDPDNGYCEIHVKIPSISSVADTSIYCFWGDESLNLLPASDTYGANQVWNYQAGDSDYVAVYHMQEASGNVSDSTLNGNTAVNYSTTSTTGKLAGNARSFNKSTPSYLQISGGLGSDIGYSQFAWVKATNIASNAYHIISQRDGVIMKITSNGYANGAYHYNNGLWSGWNEITASTDLEDDWHLIMYSCFPQDSGTREKLYVDGSQVASASESISIDWNGIGSNTFIGRHGNGSTLNYFNGDIDEVRILRNLIMSYDTYRVQWNNQSSPSTFGSDDGITTLTGSWFLLSNRNNLYNTMQLTNGLR